MTIFKLFENNYYFIDLFLIYLIIYLHHRCGVHTENHSPTILNGDATLDVQLGQSYSTLMTVQVQDTDGDTMSFSLTSDSPPGLTINKHTGALSWLTVPDMSLDATRKTVKVVVTDGKVDVLWVPNVKFCKCQVCQT